MSGLLNFFSINGYMFEVLASALFFSWWLKKKPGFPVRGACVSGALLLASVAWGSLPADNLYTRSLQTILFFLLCFLGILICFETAPVQAAFYATAAGAAQHAAYKAASTVVMVFGMVSNPLELASKLGYFFLFLVFLYGCYLIYGRKLRREDADCLTSSPMILFLLIGMQLCTNIFQNLFDMYQTGAQAYVIFNLFDIVCCLFLLSLQCEIARKENAQQNSKILEHLLHQQKQQMELSKETMDLINIKCHDIKNQIAMLGSRIPQEELQELTQSIRIYDTTFKTGNEALDILLVEKLMLCENKGIRFDCMAEGTILSFMSQSDIYSLFGNAIDNAIEAVDKLSDPDRRCLSIKVRAEKNMAVLHFENFYQESLVFEEGIPKTTKQDTRYHGFGMKSIRMITEKYHGFLSVKANQEIFTVNILIPLPGQTTF